MKTKFLYFLLLTTLLSCSNNKNSDLKLSVKNQKIPTVKVVSPQQRDFTSILQIIGNALPNKQIKIHAMEAGYVSELRKDIGDNVKKGDVLAVLHNPELSRELEINQVAKEVAEANYLRFKKVISTTPELTTIQEYEKIEAIYLMANVKYKSSLNRDSLLTVRAPFSGIITQRNIEIGTVVQSGINNGNTRFLFELMDVDIIRLVVALPETEVDNIQEGMEAVITFSELPEKEFFAKVSRMANALDNSTKTMEVQFDISNTDKQIKAGMYANVQIQLESSKDKLSLPNESIIAIKNEFFILHVENDIVRRTLIKKGLNNTQYFEILSNVIGLDSKVIIEGKAMVKEGMQVKVVE